MKQTEEEIINKAKEGCNDSIILLTEKYKETYFKIRKCFENSINNRLFDKEIFLSYPEWLIFKAARTYNSKKGASFNTWLVIIIKGHFLDSLKREKNKSLSSDNEPEDIENIANRESFFEKIKQYLDPIHYQVISYRYEYGYQPREAARQINCHYETFRNRHNKALGILRDSLSQKAPVMA